MSELLIFKMQQPKEQVRNISSSPSFYSYFVFSKMMIFHIHYNHIYNEGFESSYVPVCLDGSPPAYHMDKGFGAGINNWMVYFEVIYLLIRISSSFINSPIHIVNETTIFFLLHFLIGYEQQQFQRHLPLQKLAIITSNPQ